jgi:hypothetical protein
LKSHILLFIAKIREVNMQESILIALQVFGTGFVISLFIAVLIKVILFSIRFVTKKPVKKA